LKCLQRIIASLAQSPPGLVLLDEVMRGTNSKDKHDGTALLIQKLLNHSCLTLIATHDTELGELAAAHPGQIANFCFESELTDNGLHFDFRIRQGVAQTKNATYLMQKMGII
jgi:DNA mismatch repair ATPase MutS